MSLKILKSGILDCLQDRGRFGFRQWGITPGGVMDTEAACMANALAGNDFSEAVVELHFPASVFLFEQSTIIALAGADFSASINGEPVPIYHPIVVNKSTVLQFHSVKNQARCYLAVKGGFKINKWLNSYSTHLKAQAGGWQGSKLTKGDTIPFQETVDYSFFLGKEDFKILPWKVRPYEGKTTSDTILAVPGNEWNWLDQDSQKKFLTSEFIIAPQSDRMGYRLQGPPLSSFPYPELVSSAVCFGTVQLLPDGQLIILMADHQTAGGYPRLATIISAYRPRLAQMKSGEKFRIAFTSQKNAEELLIQQQQFLHQLQIACNFRLQNFFNRRSSSSEQTSPF